MTCTECNSEVPTKGPIPPTLGTYRCATCARLAACDTCNGVFDRAKLSVTFWGTQCASCKAKAEARANEMRDAETSNAGFWANASPRMIFRLVLAVLALVLYASRHC